MSEGFDPLGLFDGEGVEFEHVQRQQMLNAMRRQQAPQQQAPPPRKMTERELEDQRDADRQAREDMVWLASWCVGISVVVLAVVGFGWALWQGMVWLDGG